MGLYDWTVSYPDESVGQVASLEGADEARDVVVGVFLVAHGVQHHQSHGIHVTNLAVRQQTPHFLHTYTHRHRQQCHTLHPAAQPADATTTTTTTTVSYQQ